MRKFYILGLIAFVFAFTSFERSDSNIKRYHLNKLRTAGNITSYTGAPGENNCTNCHLGSTQDGNQGMNELNIVGQSDNEYTPGETLNMEFELTDPSVKNGFQLVVLDSDNEMAGSFEITSSTTQLNESTQLGRSYITHTSNGTSNSSWNFDWITPQNGGEVTFYVAANKSANNGVSSGDQIYLSQHTFTADDLTTVVQNEALINDFKIFYQKQNQRIKLDVINQSNSELFFNLVDLQGRSIQSKKIYDLSSKEETEYVHLNRQLPSGIYVATLFFNNNAVSKKIYVD